MVNQQEVDRLQDKLQSLRGAVVRNDPHMPERIDTIMKEAQRLHRESAGTAFEPALQSVEDLLNCLKRGLAAKQNLVQRYSQAV